jgi:hypothetical protein
MKMTKQTSMNKYKRVLLRKVEVLNSNLTDVQRLSAVKNISKTHSVDAETFPYSVDLLLTQEQYDALNKQVIEHAKDHNLDVDNMKPLGVFKAKEGAVRKEGDKYVVRATSSAKMPPKVKLAHTDGSQEIYDGFIRKGSIITVDISLAAADKAVLNGMFDCTVPIYISGATILKMETKATTILDDYDPSADMKDLVGDGPAVEAKDVEDDDVPF